MPKRIQRKRTKNWKMPHGDIYVGRPSKWGNPFSVKDYGSNQAAVQAFEDWLITQPALVEQIKSKLRDKDLACWCSLNEACHADVLLRVANDE